MIELTPLTDHPALHDPVMTGEWAPAFAEIVRMKQDPPWCSYLARRDGKLVASGGFKGPPDDQSWAEIAYITFIPARGQGVATAGAASLVEIALAANLEGVRAHTLPEENASTRVLVANGLVRTGDIVDPEDGPVWRWERELR